MNTLVKLFLLFIVATVLHWALAAALGGVGVGVNFMLVFAAAVCVYLKPEYGYPTAFVCGLFLDFFGVRLFGHNALTFTLCAAAVYALERRLDFDGLVPQAVSMFALCLGAALFNLLVMQIFAGFSAWTGLWPLLGGALLGAALAPFVFWAVRASFVRGVK